MIDTYEIVISSPSAISVLASKANRWLCNNIGLAFGKQEWETMLKTGKMAIPSLSLHENELVQSKPRTKVIHPKYSKHCPHILAHTIDCVCSKMLNHGLNQGLFLSLFKFFG